jgi:hypothetical protein
MSYRFTLRIIYLRIDLALRLMQYIRAIKTKARETVFQPE